MKNNYHNYFKNHYKALFSKLDVLRYKQWFTNQYELIFSKINYRGGDILEIGSAIGGFYSLLSKAQRRVYTGIELDIQAVRFANTFFRTNRFKHISIEKLSKSNKYKYIFAFEVLEHLENPSKMLKKISTLLESEGVLIATSPYPFKKNIYADKTHKYVLHPDNWKRLLIKSGFKDVETYPLSYFPFIWRLHEKLNIRLPFYCPLPHFISTSLIIAKK